eukprot:CAMPEP_0113686192 /NCGR_PEP_ID=MMETSP0038_2-20120614/15144_1 /TAXON_ID=2898 /ORGANISM="Cryptomonas paramecium" /LENGTH=156 /DNA_ID=CAMNT_0000606469 /DNA_START=304 /DNA_END=774 /DNA_ORIENTATION=+ /assembly_acc=CAM_ASM_000170
MEGQFLASLAPSSSRLGCVCPQPMVGESFSPAPFHNPLANLLRQKQRSDYDAGTSFFQVMLHDDSEHTLEYAIESLEKSLVRTLGLLPGQSEDAEEEMSTLSVPPSVMRSRRRLQWTAFQTHHYGMGVVSVLPEDEARQLVSELKKEGLQSSMVAY